MLHQTERAQGTRRTTRLPGRRGSARIARAGRPGASLRRPTHGGNAGADRFYEKVSAANMGISREDVRRFVSRTRCTGAS
jgi:hypothetical protein